MDFYRGRLIDHVHLVVRDLEASRKFYEAVLGVIGVDVVRVGDDFFWADELFVGTGEPNTGRIHLAFQAVDHDMVHRFHAAGLKAGGRDNGAPGERKYHPGTMRRSCSIRTATTSRRCITARRSDRRTPLW